MLSPPSHPEPDAVRAEFLAVTRGALQLDLEVMPGGRIAKIGAILGDRTLSFQGAFSLDRALAELDRLAAGAQALLGHNLVAHDLPILRKTAGDLPWLRLPVLDTLILSPIAFPENPYHRLIKDYKLVRESVSDPVADARLAARVLGDELKSLEGMRAVAPAVSALLHALLATPDGPEDTAAAGLGMAFGAVGGTLPSLAAALDGAREHFDRHGCASVPVGLADLQTGEQRRSLAYVASWLRVSGSNSVLPPWVRLQHPGVGEWVKRLREKPCTRPDCTWCRRVHDSEAQLKQFFGFDGFRNTPPNRRGGSLQQDIIEAGLRDESLLAILPTGGGKSLCFQLPALVRNHRRGVLTVVISPLQALMKDQVDGLVRRTGTPSAAALYGMLTPPERGDVLRRVRLGDVALLYVSPEQLRNVSFRETILQREIGCWVFDEAHCLSKWGHDFRPDYLYAGRFIREFAAAQGVEIPAIACFTATAKADVKAEIVQFFQDETGRELQPFEGGVERDNLSFEVHAVGERGKLEHIHDLLMERLPEGRPGSAIVFRATRGATETSAQYLASKQWRVSHFHAGLTPAEKKRIQDDFLAGGIQVICATNAFGMGIDKEDVRLVVHGDTPGSLENYLQEAGRAGRDGRRAECVLLYAEEDCERQFKLGALSELSRRDIAQILRGLRKAARGGQDEVVITAGEILRDPDVETDIDVRELNADTKVRTALSWLERSGFLQRDENVTRVFQARPLVRDLEQAAAQCSRLELSEHERSLWLAVMRELLNTGPGESLTVDQIALLPEFAALSEAESRKGDVRRTSHEYLSARIFRILDSMSNAGLLKRDMLLNAFVRHKVVDHSRHRLERLVKFDRKLVDVLATEEPDPEGWMPLSIRQLNQRLCDEGVESTPEGILLLLKSLSEDGRGFAGLQGSIELRHVERDRCRVRLRRTWTQITELAEKRRRAASLVLGAILARIPGETPPRADLLVEFTFDDLRQALEGDLELRSDLKDLNAALERSLMYLHEQRVVVLQQGLAVFRSAMKIQLKPEARGEKYKNSDYQPLSHHYRERILQVHVMSEYARRGLGRIQEALQLVLAYFTSGKQEFIRRYFGAKPDLLQHATTAQSFQRIVGDLGNAAQIRIVTAPVDRNLLILAGPGAGKTRTVVHRCAYLLRVERVRPHAILVCCFNRAAAVELRRRLRDLVGPDAQGVTIQTYHGLALRLLGRSLAAGDASAPGTEPDFDSLITEATRVLRGDRVPSGLDADEVRDRVLSGFQHILVDEYQDIDQPQYELISALAGRTLEDADQKLSILAVGDDDQSIYRFRGANVEFIRRFQRDYGAEVHHLVENYRSTRRIIDASNALIAANSDRMKSGQAIRINGGRKTHPAGGPFSRVDALGEGRVQRVDTRHGAHQAAAVLSEINRLRRLGVQDLRGIAVLSDTHRELALVRALAEEQGLPVRWFADRGALPRLARIREVRAFLRKVREQSGKLTRAGDLAALLPTADPAAPEPNPWRRFVRRLVEGWAEESDGAEVPLGEALDYFHEACADSRRDFSHGDGITLSTVHAAKGTEHDHVLITGTWACRGAAVDVEEQRRLLYVGMTRAKSTLAVFARRDIRSSLVRTLDSADLWIRATDAAVPDAGTVDLEYDTLGPADIHLGYAGYFPATHPIHCALGALEPGMRLGLQARDQSVDLVDATGVTVGRLSRRAAAAWQPRLGLIREARVVAVAVRGADQEDDEERRARCRVSEWEYPVVELVWEGSG